MRSKLKVSAAMAWPGSIERLYSSRNARTPAALTRRVLPQMRFTFSSHEALTGANGVPQKHDILTNRALEGRS